MNNSDTAFANTSLMTRETWLASLRGMAALLVFVSHLPLYNSYPDFGFILGRIGVVCFFLMTGYLAVYARERRSGLQYLVNRFFRLYPVFWLLLLLSFLELGTSTIPVKAWIANITLFEEFMLQPKVMGASWMLPMQVVFFITLVIGGADFFINREKNRLWNEGRGIMLLCVIMLLAIITGLARYTTNVHFPTAFFLLQGVAYMGIYFREMLDGVISQKSLCKLLVIFEIGLVISIVLSYHNAISYFIAYNIGFGVFWLYYQVNINHVLSIKLGEIGFTFFLGAEIPYYLIQEKMFLDGICGLLLGCCVKFVLAVIFAYYVTYYFEKPLLKFCKKVENI